MNIEQYLSTQVFEKRLDQRVLVVYDAALRYRDICLSHGVSSRSLWLIPRHPVSKAVNWHWKPWRGLVRVVKSCWSMCQLPVPVRDEDKQKDPFSVYGACGEVFPSGDGDSYLSLCLKAKPDHQTEVRKAFEEDPNPSFAVINGIGGGLQWPTLRALLKVESSPEIVSALMVPDENQKTELLGNEAWAAEAKQLFDQVLGLTLTTRGKKWKSISEELWRFVLFSEFVFDLPGELPESLAGVPKAHSAAKPIIESFV